MSRSSGLALPDIGDVVPLLLLGGGAYFLLAPGSDGTSLLSKFGGAVVAANAAAGAVGAAARVGGAAAGGVGVTVANIVGVGGAPNNPGPANGAGDTFNINTDPNVSWARVLGGGALGAVLAGAHVGVGHQGNGGRFVCRLWAQTTGFLGIGGSAPIQLAQQDLWTNHDGNWAGYGVDFGTMPIAGLAGGWFGPGSMSVWADVLDSAGNLFTQANLPLVTV